MDEEEDMGISFDQICPECGVGNPRGASNCLICDKNLVDTIAFMEDDCFDLEITKDYLVEYRKNFWGTNRTGKIVKYRLDKIKNIQFGSPVKRLIFIYENKRVVIPLKDENMEVLMDFFKKEE